MLDVGEVGVHLTHHMADGDKSIPAFSLTHMSYAISLHRPQRSLAMTEAIET
jgi:hypothetical protein